MAFVHLRAHTEYSVVDGTLRIDDAIDAAAKDRQAALAITDLSNLFGAVKFYSAARREGIKPIVGADLWLEPESGEKSPSRMVVLAQDRQGYLNLCELLSRGWLRNGQRGQAWLQWAWLEELNGGLIALSGAEHGAVGQALASRDHARAETLARRCASVFERRFYLELQRAGLPGQEHHVASCAS
jgi:DNA polymerase III subunit alpha